MTTLLLDRTAWDLCKDADGNIALASDPYATAQDVATAIRLFYGELWYDTTKGVQWFQDTLGKPLSAGLFKADMVNAALSVPNVASAVCSINSVSGRVLDASVVVTTVGGVVFTVRVGPGGPIRPFVIDLNFSDPNKSGYLPGL